ncbi:probable ADE12-adenylosuccinate synthetase [Fusarium fujikuroi]|nr:probable ADE12-adenylosuccinate synthetase [Fusarium fujikuroi]SCN87581.1 probable ADE12-adenylosuccinate synthetase [Fusarium fujikuroi]SCN88877.1 probable ADE12-adenylosuccinate synthetase [Fusarium fujikuroi]SCV40305.1 probable ADE12-adenylosuccinate synthetase [Fusarium fujikuroi]
MAITVILGAQWGDEGVSTQGELNTTDDTQALTILQKGKLVDGQCQEAQLCARAAGGHNAGHLVRVNGVSYSFHLLPSGLINPRCMNFIGSGVVFHVPSFFSELKELEKNLTAVHDRILVSDRVNILLDLHIAVDGLEEEELGDAAIGTTRRGMLTPGLHDGLSLSAFVTSSQTFPNLNGVDNPSIGPCYQTSRARTGIKMTDVFNPEVFEQKLRRLANGFQKRFGELLKYDIEAELARFDEYRQTLSKYVVDGVAFMKSAQESNMKIVIEGANFVTSSSTTLAGIIGGLALNPKNITETVGVVKAYTTRVGAGAFKTEDTEEIGTKLQEIGREWGTSTGRRRRCGWLGRYNLETLSNLVVVKYSNSINYYDSLNLTKLDVLDTFETIKIAIAYKIDGEELDSYPADLDILNRAEVVYHEMPGWQKPTTNARTYYDLPRAARDYIEYIEKFVGVKIKYIGTGPDREAMVQRA